MNLTKFLAVWGAIVSTIALTWNVIRDRHDRGILKLNTMIGKMYPDHTDRDYVVLTITNVGRRPILVMSWGWIKKGRKGDGFLVKTSQFPKMLKEGEYHIEFTHDF
ncbi:MAG: hypothetical protein HY694_08230 [Deltaproteobacteria bacterium]|nr:hypothetical protein [Deltaproteobacteria bacterium]